MWPSQDNANISKKHRQKNEVIKQHFLLQVTQMLMHQHQHQHGAIEILIEFKSFIVPSVYDIDTAVLLRYSIYEH